VRYKTINEPKAAAYNLEKGDEWIHPTTSKVKVWNGTAWEAKKAEQPQK